MEEPVNIIAPENLPPPADVPPKVIIFDRQKKIEIVAELIKTAQPVSAVAAKYSVTPAQLRGWSNAYNVEAVKWLKAQTAESLLGDAPPDQDDEGGVKYTATERRMLLARYRASGLSPLHAADLLKVHRRTLMRWIEAEAALEQKYTPRKAIAGPGANIEAEARVTAVNRMLAGDRIQDVARDLLVSQKSIRNWYLKQTGQKLKARDLIKKEPPKMETKPEPVKIPTPSTKKSTPRRFFSGKEKILYAVRAIKLGVSIEQAAKQLKVGISPLRMWVKAFHKLKPQQKAAAKMAAHGKISDDVRYKAIADIEAGIPAREVAEKYGVHRDSIKAWYVSTGKKWPNQYDKIDRKKPLRRFRDTDPRAIDAVNAVANGTRISKVADELGVKTGTIRMWWRHVKGNTDWPNQYTGQGGVKKFKRGPNGPQKKTLDRISVREAVLSNSMVLTAAQKGLEELNGHAQPISTGKATHDALVFLRLARDEYTKGVKAGNIQIDEPAMLFTMLAFHTLSK
jgi:transposase-like protein